MIASHSGHLAFDAGDVTRAVALYAEALSISTRSGIQRGLSRRSNGWRWRLRPEERLFLRSGCSEPQRRHARRCTCRRGSKLMRKRVASGLDQAMRAADTERTAALAEGRALSLERARDEALELARDDAGSRRTSIYDGPALPCQFDARLKKSQGAVRHLSGLVPFGGQDDRHCESLAEAADLDERLGREGRARRGSSPARGLLLPVHARRQGHTRMRNGLPLARSPVDHPSTPNGAIGGQGLGTNIARPVRTRPKCSARVHDSAHSDRSVRPPQEIGDSGMRMLRQWTVASTLVADTLKGVRSLAFAGLEPAARPRTPQPRDVS